MTRMISEYDSYACDPKDEILTPCDTCKKVPDGFICNEDADNFEDCPRWKALEVEAYEEFRCGCEL